MAITPAAIAVSVYGLGFVVMSIVSATWFYKTFYPFNEGLRLGISGMYAILTSLFWPIIVPCLALGWMGRQVVGVHEPG
jgi:hypothetical protein